MKKLIVILLFLPLSIFAQQNNAALEKQARKLVREGTELYNQEKYADAEVAFKKAIDNAPDYEIAKYNLGNALLQQNRNKEAIEQYELVAKTTQDKFTKAQAMHNIGNSYFVDKEYQKSIDAYKHSLRANPKDDETRYNLALAQKMLEDQQQDQDNKDDNKDKDKENKDNQDQNQDKKEGDDEKKDDEKQEGDDKKDPEKDKKDQEQKEQPQQGKLSPQQVQQLLDAMNNEEKKTQEKMNAKKERGKKVKQEKDW